MSPKSSYIICATPRSGSYLLCEALRNTGVAGQPTEYVSPTFEGYWAAKWGTSSYREYLDKVLEVGTSSNGVFGMKVHIHQFLYSCGKMRLLPGMGKKTEFELMRAVYGEHRYVWIRRRDKLAQAISYLKATQSNIWWDSEVPPAPYSAPTPERMHFDLRGIDRDMARMEREDAEWKAYFDAHDIEPIEVFYEELTTAYDATALRVLHLLGILPPLGLQFSTRLLKKQANGESRRWAERYMRLSRARSEKTLSSFKDLHRGESVYVCGLGVSLNQLDHPEHYVTIGVNDIGRKFHPNYLLVVDPRKRLTPQRYKHIDTSQAEFVFTDRDYAIPHATVVRFPLCKRSGPNFANPHELHFVSRPWYSPYIALHLAAHMGASRVGMIGVDFADHHFYAKTGPYEGTKHMAQVETHFRNLNNALILQGVKTFNLSARSRLTCFPKLALEDFRRLPELERDDDLRKPYRLVCYAAEEDDAPAANLARSIGAVTRHSSIAMCGQGTARCRCDLNWRQSAATAEWELAQADAVVMFGETVAEHHRAFFEGKRVIYANHLPPAIPTWDMAHQKVAPPEQLTISCRAGLDARADGAIIPLLQSLADEFGAALDFSGVGHAHIVVDENLRRGYGTSSLEGLAQASVVVNSLGIFPERREQFRRWADSDDLPFVHACEESLERTLRRLLQRDIGSLINEGDDNRIWLERHWDFRRHWDSLWMPLLGRCHAADDSPGWNMTGGNA
jgi:LPS sulfotransferase NodH